MAKKKKSNGGPIFITFTKKRDTKRTRVYEEDGWDDNDPDGAGNYCGSIYLRNSRADEFGGSLPEKLKVTIE